MRSLFALSLALIFTGFPVFSKTNSSTNKASSEVEKIKVTGSRIKRIDLEGPSPVTIFDAEDLKQSGYNSVADFLRDTTISSAGVSRGLAGGSSVGQSYLGIHGEGALVLINGLRLSKDPIVQGSTSTAAVDLNLIPINAVERIEILRDGGSALYGSDAVGGVINFITKKDFSGQIFDVSLSSPPLRIPTQKEGEPPSENKLDDALSGSEASGGVTFGGKNKLFSYVGSLNTRYRENVGYRQRAWWRNLYSSTGPEPIYFDSNGNVLHSDCPEEKKRGEVGCQFDYSLYADMIPKYFQINGFSQIESDMGESTFYSQFLGSYRWTQYYYAPIPVSAFSKPPIAIPPSHKMGAGTTVSAPHLSYSPTTHSPLSGQEVLVSHRFMEAGKRNTLDHYFLADLTLGSRGYIGKTWDYDFSVKGSHIIKATEERNLLLKDKTIEAITSGKYNPSAPKKENLSEAIFTANGRDNSSLLFSSLEFSGESGVWDINLATGFQAYFERYQTDSDDELTNKNSLSGVGSDGEGVRYVGSYYLEGMKNFKDQLELQAAWRLDYYSDFGLTNFGLNNLFASEENQWSLLDYLIGTPKLAFRFQPRSDVLFRGSVSSSFVAPSLSNLYGSESSSFDYMFDTPGCIAELQKADLPEGVDEVLKDVVIYEDKVLTDSSLSDEQKKFIEDEKIVDVVTDAYSSTEACQVKQYFATIRPNEELKETRALVASLGTVFEITPEFTWNIDLTYIAKSNIASGGLNDSDGVAKRIYDREAQVGTEELENLYNIDIERRTQDETLKNITTKILNLGKSRKLYLNLGFRSLFKDDFYYNNELFVFFQSLREEFPGFGFEETLGKFGTPRWKNVAHLGWKKDNHHVFVKALSMASVEKDSGGDFPLSTRFDLIYEYVINEKMRLNVNVYNLFSLNLNLNKDKEEEESLISLSLKGPVDMETSHPLRRLDSDFYGFNGQYISARLSYRL